MRETLSGRLGAKSDPLCSPCWVWKQTQGILPAFHCPQEQHSDIRLHQTNRLWQAVKRNSDLKIDLPAGPLVWVVHHLALFGVHWALSCEVIKDFTELQKSRFSKYFIYEMKLQKWINSFCALYFTDITRPIQNTRKQAAWNKTITYDCCVFSNSTDSTSSFIWAFSSSSSDPLSSSLSGFGLGSGIIWVAKTVLGAGDGKGDETDVCKKNRTQCVNSTKPQIPCVQQTIQLLGYGNTINL